MSRQEKVPRLARPELSNTRRLYDILHTPTRLTLVFEYAEKDLKDYMTAHKQLLLREPFISKVRLHLTAAATASPTMPHL